MITADDIIQRAFLRAGIATAEKPLAANEVQDGLVLLNDMGSMWEQDLLLGFEPVENISDEVRIPRFAKMAFVEGLAVRLGPEYQKPVDPVLVASADDAMAALERAVINIDRVEYPSTLPLGSGNECPDLLDRRFFDTDKPDNF